MRFFAGRRCIWDGASTQNDVPSRARVSVRGDPGFAVLQGVGFSRQGYYAWRADPVCERDWSDARVINEIRSIRKKDSTFGYRLITDELKDVHVVMGENRVHRLCRACQVFCVSG